MDIIFSHDIKQLKKIALEYCLGYNVDKMLTLEPFETINLNKDKFKEAEEEAKRYIDEHKKIDTTIPSKYAKFNNYLKIYEDYDFRTNIEDIVRKYCAVCK